MRQQLFVVIAGAALLTSGVTAAFAQSKPNPAQPAATRKATKPAPQPASATAPVVTGEPGRLSDYWTIEQALPSRSADRARTAATSQVGRAPLQNAPGTVGLTSGTIRSTEFSDGRPVPGLTQNTQRDSSYVGLSLSVSSSNNAFPIPLLPPPGSASGW